MSIYLCITLLILFTSTTLVQGHDVLDMNTADYFLSSSSELENTLTEHSNPIRIGKFQLSYIEMVDRGDRCRW
jgi:hypothetical protein